jgi:streptogramin lyase
MRFWISAVCLVAVAASPAFAHDWNGMAQDSKGRIYVVDGDSGRIWRIATDGKVELFIDAKVGGSLVHPHHLAIDGDDNVWVATNCVEITKNRIFRIGQDRRPVEVTWEAPKDFLLEMVLPDKNGGLYLIGASSILYRAKDGALAKEPAATIGSGPGAVCLTKDGDLVVGDKDRVSIVSRGKAREIAKGLGDVYGVAVDSSGTIYAADWQGGRVVKVDSKGATTVLTTGLTYPSGVLIAADGMLYVKESGRQKNELPRVKRVDAAGKATVFNDLAATGQ